MKSVKLQKLSKQFISYKKQPGLKGAIKSFISREQIKKDALLDFDLEINQGEIIGLLGPNGAGKTTLMKMLTGIIVPSSGKIDILGHTPSDRALEFRKKIALVMGQKSQLWWDIPAMDSFELLQKYYEIPNKQFKDKIHQMSELLQVKNLLHQQVRRLSLGERMKLELMASLLHSPEIIFLDEPTIGLDLIAQESIRQFILDYHQESQATILLTSHYMADVVALCSRIVLIAQGKKAYDGPIGDFEQILGRKKLVSFYAQKDFDLNHKLFKNLSPQLVSSRQIELSIPVEDLSHHTQSILSEFSITDFHTEKLPIEKVMKTLMENPHLLKEIQ